MVDPTIGAADAAAAPAPGEANSENACSSLLLLAVGDYNDAGLPASAGDAIYAATEGNTN